MANRSINNAIRIPATRSDFFVYWFKFLRPFHNLTEQGIKVAAALVENRYRLAKSISDNEILDAIAFNTDSKRQIREKYGINPAHFNMILSNLKKAKVIVDNKINPKFIPNVNDGDNFQLLITFEYED